MDMLYLLDRLEEVIASSTHMPFSSRTLIDPEEALEIVEQIRVAVPEEVRQARRLNGERESILKEAAEKAEEMLQQAEQAVAERVSNHEVSRMAQIRASEIEEDALRAAQRIRRESDEYAYEIMQRIKRQLEILAGHVEEGTQALERSMSADDTGVESDD